MPEVFKQSDGRFWVDYGFHIAPIEAGHIDEMEHLALDHGVPSFKIFMDPVHRGPASGAPE